MSLIESLERTDYIHIFHYVERLGHTEQKTVWRFRKDRPGIWRQADNYRVNDILEDRVIRILLHHAKIDGHHVRLYENEPKRLVCEELEELAERKDNEV